jgi:cell division protein FtsN
MIKDYAKHKSSYKFKPQQTKSRKKILALAVIFALIIISLIFALSHFKRKPKSALHNTITVSKPRQAAADNSTKVKFDFYTILSKKKASDIKSPATPNTSYYLEIISVTNNHDAELLKNELSILGFSAVITPGHKGTKILNTGPYYSLDSAKSDQKKLRDKNINSTLKKK